MVRTLKNLLNLIWLLALVQGAAAESASSHGLSLHRELKYPAGFSHLEYVNPEAPKGGELRLAEIGTFDSLNPFILKGIAPAGISGLHDTLTYNSNDEAFSEYGLIAESIEVAPDHSWVIFNLRSEARFHDGSPITATDVIFSFEALKERGHPFYRSYYAPVEKAEALGPRKVKFYFQVRNNRELPLTIGQMPVLSEKYWRNHDFGKTTLDAPVGSGPYRIDSVEPGRFVRYQRVADYWGAKLPVNVGRHNFDTIRYDYYRDSTVALEAFKAGEYSLRLENTSKLWATGYTGPALESGKMRQEEIFHQRPTGMQGFVYNTRRALFSDRRVREALAYAFDFEWTNRNLFYGAYTRTNSYFSNSELAAPGLPEGEELRTLEGYRGKIPDELFSRAYTVPSSTGRNGVRRNLRTAARLLRKAGWVVRDQRLVHAKTGQPFSFEVLLVSPAFERVVLPFKRNLARLGIEMRVRTVDSAQYQKRLDNFDFDMSVYVWGQSLSPGNEQQDFWSAKAANIPGSRNLAGVQDPVVDELIAQLVSSPDRKTLIQRTRALDRVLLWGYYVIPHWHIRSFRVAYWDIFGRPGVIPKYALGLDTWWLDSAKAAALETQPAK